MSSNNPPGSGPADAPKIHIDSDWKAQARAEKEKMAAKAAPAGDKPAAGRAAPGQMPPASFETLVSTLATQALFYMGAIPHPQTGQRVQALDMARHQIDMLNVIDAKTKNNLTEEEANIMAQTLYELRSRYISASSALRG